MMPERGGARGRRKRAGACCSAGPLVGAMGLPLLTEGLRSRHVNGIDIIRISGKPPADGKNPKLRVVV